VIREERLMSQPFDPEFDDCTWTDAWMHHPIIQVIPGVYDSFVVKSWHIDKAYICGRAVRFSDPMEVRGLITSTGRLWMSDVPQERLMMYNNACRSQGRVLVGGLGVGLYPQYAILHGVKSLVIVEQERAVKQVVEPVVRIAAEAHGVGLEVQVDTIEEILRSEAVPHYDTIFLDTWDTLDAVHLPYVNHLRDLAIPHLRPGGRVLLWGYRWMVRLFEQACQQLLGLPPENRQTQLASSRPEAQNLLKPILARFDNQVIENWESALRWCKDYAVQITSPESAKASKES
jgi:hypothetical protein